MAVQTSADPVTPSESGTDKQPGISASRMAAEDRAIDILARRGHGGRITHADLWAVASLWRCSPNRNRKRLSTEGAGSVPSDTFGLVSHGVLKTWYVTKRTMDYPNVCILLNRYFFGQLTLEQALGVPLFPRSR